jgi:hypothetical protein
LSIRDFADQGNLYRSLDGGQTWNFLRIGSYPWGSLLVDPRDSNYVYLNQERSVDGGDTWEEMLSVGAYLALDAAEPSILYGARPGPDVMWSSSRGVIWNDVDVSGLPTDGYMTAFAADPAEQGRVFVGFGFDAGGVYTEQIAVYTVDVEGGSVPPPPPPGALLAAPNPFRDTVSLALPAGVRGDAVTHATLAIFDAAGRHVRTLKVSDETRSITWDGRDASGDAVPPGVYISTLRIDEDAVRSVRLVKLD